MTADKSFTKKPGKTGTRPALLVIDVQNRYLNYIPGEDKEMAFFFINLLIDLFREHSYPVFRIYHLSGEKDEEQGSGSFEYPPDIQVRDEDTKLVKTYSDSFNKTELDRLLREKGVNTLFLCGLSAVGCVLATRTGAFNHDYKAFIVKDAIMSHRSEYTRNVEAMFDAISFEAVKLILQNSK
ncbi:MAG TPA: isochorismatase family cysteine hydrolase [Bacteroidales bacterium]|nr:isochorismatase family cysteine hydrolase [Bacteroidales bacterium]